MGPGLGLFGIGTGKRDYCYIASVDQHSVAGLRSFFGFFCCKAGYATVATLVFSAYLHQTSLSDLNV